jgi:predicted AlkP superfamily pyrophosphatase or phosphodiesterase
MTLPRIPAVLIGLLLTLTTASAQTTRPVPAIRRALIISVDGLRPDVVLRADAPRIRGLVEGGSFTFWARTTAQSSTLPTHVSLLTGCTPEVHAILWNGDLPLSQPVYPRSPTLFELAKKAGYSTALVAGKSKFDFLNKPGTIDFAYFPDEPKSEDAAVTRHAVDVLRQHKPDVMFVHFPGADVVGHAKGWGTREQLAAIASIDRCVGEIIDTMAQQKLLDSTVIFLTADHGGAGRTHGPDDPRSRHIPWIANGPGIRQGYDLTMNRELVVDVYDTFNCVCKLLDIPVTRKVNGKFIEDILEQRELLGPAK